MYRSFREEAVFVQNLQHTLAKSSKIIYTGSTNRHKAHSEGIEICHVKERRFIWCFVYIKNNNALGFFFFPLINVHFNTTNLPHLSLVL